jgi:4'-phosphopantetheinyl transferase
MSLVSNSWKNTSSLKVLSQECLNGEVHIWCLDFNELCSTKLRAYHNLLSQDEKERARKFYFEKDRDHFICARGILRCLIGMYLDIVPSSLVFKYNLHSKPLLDVPPGGSDIYFNVTHSKNVALYAFSRTYPVGVDIEFIRQDLEWKALAENFFSINESCMIQSIEPCHQIEAFYCCWTRKEALLKGLGLGLSIPLNHFEVSVSPDETEVQPVYRSDLCQLKDWIIWSLPSLSNYVSALATKGSPRMIKSFKFSSTCVIPPHSIVTP